MDYIALTDATLINGISLTVIGTIATVFGVLFLRRYFREKKKLLPFVGILFLCWTAQYLGPLTTFWSLVFTAENIDPLLYYQLSYTITPFSIINAIWLSFSIFNEKRRTLVTIIYIVTAVPYHIAQFGFPTLMFTASTPAEGEILDLSLKSITLLLCFTYILTAMVVIGGSFLWLRKRVTGSERRRATYVGIGYIFFGFGTILDVISTTITVLIIGRILMAIYLVFIYLGFSRKAPAKDADPPIASE
jgi:hypothetical protein